MRKVNIEVMRKWCTERLTEILGFEDDIVINLAINLLEAPVLHFSLRQSIIHTLLYCRLLRWKENL